MAIKGLVACEFSQVVTKAFRDKGHEFYSCDILPTEGNPEWHIQDDVLNHLNDGWDIMIAFPPCTHIAIAGAAWFELKKKDGRQQQGIDFFMSIINAPIEKICVENPIGIMSNIYKKPSQIIHPYYFGDEFSKPTCLWLKNLPKLWHWKNNDLFGKKTHVFRGEFITTSTGKRLAKWTWRLPKSNDRWKIKSRTFQGIANAMAEQWS